MQRLLSSSGVRAGDKFGLCHSNCEGKVEEDDAKSPALHDTVRIEKLAQSGGGAHVMGVLGEINVPHTRSPSVMISGL